MRHQPEQFEARGWAEHLSSRLCIELDRRVDRLREIRQGMKRKSSPYAARNAAKEILEWALIADLLGDLKDSSSLRRLFGERDAIEAYVRTLMESHE